MYVYFYPKNRPQGKASVENFSLKTVQTSELTPGQVMVRQHFLSVDPYMWGRMNDAKSYAIRSRSDKSWAARRSERLLNPSTTH